MAIGRPLDAADEELPDDLFAKLSAQSDARSTLALPTLRGLEERLASIQTAVEEARAEALALREELRLKAQELRKLAAALDAV